MKKISSLLLALALPCLSWGQLVMFRADLSGAQDVPAVPSNGQGLATASLDLADRDFVLDFSFSGLSAPETAAHIHTGAFGTNGPVTIPFPLGPVHLEQTLTQIEEDSLLAGMFYVNVHTSSFPGGEIRGQLMPVPEPSTYALAGVALLGLVAYRRSRKGKTAAAGHA